MESKKYVAWLQVVHLMSLSLWWGGTVFFSFIAAPRIFGYLQDRLPLAPPPGVTGYTAEVGRRVAGDTVGGIFPAYFAIQVVAGLLAVITATVLVRVRVRRAKTRCILAAAAWMMVTLHSLTVYPHSIGILDEHYGAAAVGDATRAAALRKSFGAWHGLSQTINLATIATVTGALALAALRDAEGCENIEN